MPQPATPNTVLIVTDAWHPQINGVVRSIELVAAELEKRGITVKMLTPNAFRDLPHARLWRDTAEPHADEAGLRQDRGSPAPTPSTSPPKGRWASSPGAGAGGTRCSSRPPTTPSSRNICAPACRCRCAGATASCAGSTARQILPRRHAALEDAARESRLLQRGDLAEGRRHGPVQPGKRGTLPYPGPVFLYVGRVAVEKNIEAFLGLDLPGTKLVVGGGPSLERLKAEYADVTFRGPKQGEELATLFASGRCLRLPVQDRYLRPRPRPKRWPAAHRWRLSRSPAPST